MSFARCGVVIMTISTSLTLVGACGTSMPSTRPLTTADTSSRSPASPSGTLGSFAPLASEEPLVLPTFSGTCPRSSGHQVLPNVGLGLGNGPAWPVGFGATGTQTLGRSLDGISYPVKVLWAATHNYMGPIRVRGQRIDQPGTMEFSLDGGVTRAPELNLPADLAQTSDRTWPSYVFVESPGCYAFQVDGTNFTEVVVFELTT